jgi:hypothetical protein
METEDLLTFPESDAPVYNYFTNEKELIETKQKVKELEDKLKDFESRMKKVKEVEDRLLKLEKKRVKELEDKLKRFENLEDRLLKLETDNSGPSIFPMLDKSNTSNESLRFYNINAETIKIDTLYQLFIDDELFSSNIMEFINKGDKRLEYLKQFKRVKQLIIEFIPIHNQCEGSYWNNVTGKRDSIIKICSTILKVNNCEIVFKTDSLYGVHHEIIQRLFTTCFNLEIYKKITIEIKNNLNVVGGQASYASADFITQTKKHCDKNNIEFKSNLGL